MLLSRRLRRRPSAWWGSASCELRAPRSTISRSRRLGPKGSRWVTTRLSPTHWRTAEAEPYHENAIAGRIDLELDLQAGRHRAPDASSAGAPRSAPWRVKFLFTDIEGSTNLLHELGPAGYAEALAEHRRALARRSRDTAASRSTRRRMRSSSPPRPQTVPSRRRRVPALGRGRSRAHPAGGRRKPRLVPAMPERRRKKSPALTPNPRLARVSPRGRIRPVAPEVAGSSPVAPVNSLQISIFSVIIDATDRGFLVIPHSSRTGIAGQTRVEPQIPP
jgi:hypothetical protein